MLIGHMARALREEEAGQAVVVGALSMLILALAVLATAQLGRGIERRVQLQAAADDAAYSVAAAAARSLNFAAWANRTVVAHYVSMIALQSLSSYLTGLQTLMWRAGDLLQTISALACAGVAICPGCGLGALSRAADAAGRALHELVDSTWSAVDELDSLAARGVEGLGALNLALSKAAEDLRRDTERVLADESPQSLAMSVARAAVPEANAGSSHPYLPAMAELNGAAYRRLFDQGALAIPPGGTALRGESEREDDKVQNAERLMAEITNASRTGRASQAGGVRFESHRRLGGHTALAGPAAAAVGLSLAGTSRLVSGMSPRRFTEGAVPRGDPGDRQRLNDLFEGGRYATQFSRGAALASAEHVSAIGPDAAGRSSGIVGIQAWPRASDPMRSFHCRLPDDPSQRHRLIPLAPGCPKVALTTPPVCVNEGGRHRFGGLSPYLSFALSEDSAESFGQPDFYALAHLAPKEARLAGVDALGFGGGSPFVWRLGRTASLDGVGEPGLKGPMPGLHAWARSQVYYHRPGHWTEPPNLFNPFWKARLAPVERRVELLLARAHLSPAHARLVRAATVH